MATLFTATVSDILDYLSDIRGESTTNTDAKRIRAVSRAERSIAKRSPWELFYIPDQTITSTGATTYTIASTTYPLRNKGLKEVFVNGTNSTNRYNIIDQSSFKDAYSENALQQMCYVYYDAANDAWKLFLSPTPESGVTITYSYFWQPPKRTSTSDTIYTVNDEAVTRTALAEIYDSEDEGELAALERNKVENILVNEIDVEEGAAPGQTFIMTPYTNGFGNY